jgi:uncharacterized protein (DUF1778 family)
MATKSAERVVRFELRLTEYEADLLAKYAQEAGVSCADFLRMLLRLRGASFRDKED